MTKVRARREAADLDTSETSDANINFEDECSCRSREIRMQYSTEYLRDRVVRICQSKTSKKVERNKQSTAKVTHLYSGSNDLTESKWNRRVEF
jgi:hypothetical protein